MTQEICPSLNHWPHKSFDQFQIYVHPDLELNLIENRITKFALIGYMIDPRYPERSNTEILNDMIKFANSFESVSEYLYSLSGRFVLVVNISGKTSIFHDPCGLRSVYYSQYEGKKYVGSQPSIFSHVIPLTEGDMFFSYKNSEYRNGHSEHWTPSGCSLYENIQQLIPNHYLCIQSLKQIRYWPNRKLQERKLDDVIYETSELLTRLMQAGNVRFNLALALTAGIDSRMLLGACKKIAKNIFFVTLLCRKLRPDSADIQIPRKILKKAGYRHHLIDCRKNIDVLFSGIYRSNVSNSREDLENLVHGMFGQYPQNRVFVLGNISEISRCFYYKSGKHPPIYSVKQLIELEDGWKELNFVCDQLSDWYSEIQEIVNVSGIDILDLFYWEHRMGSWLSQSQLEYDIVLESYTPFNHRGLLEAMLGVPQCYRCAPDYILQKKIATVLWPEIMEQPVNPPYTIKAICINLLYRFGLADIAIKILMHLRLVQWVSKLP